MSYCLNRTFIDGEGGGVCVGTLSSVVDHSIITNTNNKVHYCVCNVYNVK